MSQKSKAEQVVALDLGPLLRCDWLDMRKELEFSETRSMKHALRDRLYDLFPPITLARVRAVLRESIEWGERRS